MNSLVYFAAVIGEPRERLHRLHTSTIARIKAFALAMHLPVALWGLQGYFIARKLFQQSPEIAIGVALGCIAFVYLIERLVLATPKCWLVNGFRISMGMIVAVLGASLADLVIFEREVNEQLTYQYRADIDQDFGKRIAAQEVIVASLRNEWDKAQAAATCEANGTCGSGRVSVGPIYKELARQAEIRRNDMLQATEALRQEKARWALEARHTEHPDVVAARAGLLARIEALHHYVRHHEAAFAAWMLFFLLVSCVEGLVLVMKFAFGETVDDRIERAREALSDHRLRDYVGAATSPLYEAHLQIGQAFGAGR